MSIIFDKPIKAEIIKTAKMVLLLSVFSIASPSFAQDFDADNVPDLASEIQMQDDYDEQFEEIPPFPENEDVEDVTDASPFPDFDPTDTSDPDYIDPDAVIQPVESDVAMQPPANQLNEPAAQNAQAPTPTPTVNTPTAEQSEPAENVFYDAEALVPQSDLANTVPRKVDPRLEPASRLVVVKRDSSASSTQAQLIAAQRAMKLGRYESALEIYETLYAKNKKDPATLMGRAVAYQKLGQDDFAVQAYEDLLEIRPKSVEAKVNMLGIIGKSYPSVAIRQLMELYEDNSDNIGVVAQIAVVQAELGNYQDAIRFLGMAASMEPQNASHLFNMAVIADRAGSRPDAIKYYEEALEVDTLYGKGMSIPRESVFERLARLR